MAGRSECDQGLLYYDHGTRHVVEEWQGTSQQPREEGGRQAFIHCEFVTGSSSASQWNWHLHLQVRLIAKSMTAPLG